MRILRALAIIAALSPGIAAAQTLPPGTVQGRLPPIAGPVEAIPFATLVSQLQLFADLATVTLPVTSGNLACWNGTSGILQDCGSAPVLNEVTPEQFYKVSDGADWGLAIDRALVALSALPGGGTLQFGCGVTYNIASYSPNALSAIRAFSGVNMHSCGSNTHIRIANGVNTSSSKFIYGIAGTGTVSNVRYDGFTLDMNGANNSCSGTCYAPNAGIQITTGNTIFLDNITFINNPGSNDTVFGTVSNPATVSNLHLSNLHHNNYGDRVNAASTDFSADFAIAKNYVVSNITYDNGPTVNGAAFEFHGDGAAISNLVVNNNINCGIIANLAAAPLTQNINLNNVKCNNVKSGITIFSFAASALTNINISDVTVNFLSGASGTGIDACTAMNSASGPNINLNITGVIVNSAVQTNLGNNTSGIWGCYWRSANVQNNVTFNTQGPGVRFSTSVASGILTIANNQIINPGFTSTTALQVGVLVDATSGVTLDTVAIENNSVQGTVVYGVSGAQNTTAGIILGTLAADATGAVVNWTGTGLVPVPAFPSGMYSVVGNSLTQTLTNKTISGASNTLTNIPNSATTATNANTASAIVARDGSGNFAAGTITAALTGHASLDLALTGGTMSGALAGVTALTAGVDGSRFNLGPGGTGTTSAELGMNGGSGTGAGALLLFQKNSATSWFLGHVSRVEASGTSNDLEYFNQSTGARTMRLSTADDSVAFASAINATSGTVGAINTLGGIGVTKDIWGGGQEFLPSITTSSAAQTGTVCWTTGTGKFTVDTTVGCLTSLLAAKNITEKLSPVKALNIVNKLDPFAFRYKKGWGDGGQYEQFGLGAEEVAAVDERLVGRDPAGKLQGVRYQEMGAVFVGAIQQLKTENDALRSCNNDWKCRLFGWR